jgi:hypothetical protein
LAIDPEARVRFPALPEKKTVGLERGLPSLVSTTEELLDRKVAAPVYKTENTAVGIRHADHVAPSIHKRWQSLRRQAAVARSVEVRSRTQTMEFFYEPPLPVTALPYSADALQRDETPNRLCNVTARMKGTFRKVDRVE